MSTVETSPRSRTGAGTRPQWFRAALAQLGVQGYVALWFWALCLVVVTAATLLVERVGSVEISLLHLARQGGLWLPFSISVIITAVHLTVHVTSGMTRRSFIRAALLTATVTGLLYATLMSLGLLVEGWVYAAQGWPHGTAGDGGDAMPGGFWLTLLSTALVYTAGTLSGLLVGLTYYRTGAWWGTLALPLTLAPILLVSVLASPGPWTAFDLSVRPQQAVAGLGSLAVLAVSAAAVHLLARRVPIASTRA